MNSSLQKGISLTELSFSLTIISFLAIVVMGAGSLVESSNLNKFTREIQEVEQANRTFRSVYNATAGDFKNAQTHFGSTGVANGDGNGIIAQGSNDTADEVNNAMVHLAKANLIYTTSLANNGTKYLELKSYPGYLYLSSNKESDGTAVSGFSYVSGTHNFIIAAANGYGYNAFITPKTAHNVDKKIDDGFPRSGNITYIVAGDVSDASCTNSSTEYYLTSTSLACNLSYQID